MGKMKNSMGTKKNIVVDTLGCVLCTFRDYILLKGSYCADPLFRKWKMGLHSKMFVMFSNRIPLVKMTFRCYNSFDQSLLSPLNGEMLMLTL